MGIEVAIGAMIAATAAAAAGTAYSVVSSEQGRKAQGEAMSQQKQAQDRAAADAARQAEKSQEAINAANRKSPDVSGILGAAAKSAAGGPSGTMLTGPTGVNPNDLTLGKNTLLGG
jgi:type II secretory pathway pseudopilin PulG